MNAKITTMQPDKNDIDRIITMALAEDVGSGDATSIITIPNASTARFFIRAREEMVMCGGEVAVAVFAAAAAGGSMTVEIKMPDGKTAKSGDILVTGHGAARAVMAGERVALNLLRQMCGTATITRQYITAMGDTKAKLLDTRKTIPGLRALQKYAVTVGGGHNHRFGLYDGILIKDNHIAICGGVEEAINMARKNIAELPNIKNPKIEIECDALYQVREAVKCGADIILLDNMALSELVEAVAIVGGKIPLEASGGVNLASIRAIAATGVNYISVGSITNTPANVDIGLDME